MLDRARDAGGARATRERCSSRPRSRARSRDAQRPGRESCARPVLGRRRVVRGERGEPSAQLRARAAQAAPARATTRPTPRCCSRPVLGAPPREIAAAARRRAAPRLSVMTLRGYEVAGPGFLNLVAVRRLAPGGAAHRARRRRGVRRRRRASAERILLEFVSANPTGPLVAASGRHAAYGDSLARILAAPRPHGLARVLLQRRRLADPAARRVGAGPRARRRGARGRLPGRVRGRARRRDPGGGATATSTRSPARAVEMLLAQIKATLDRYGVRFDTFFSERDAARGLAERGRAGAGAARARPATSTSSEGAVWLRTTTFGDDKDRVLLRSGGEPTYFAADVAYMLNKRERGFERQLLPVGADHHGYVARLKAAFAALGRRSGHGSRCRSSSSSTSSRATSGRRCPSAAASS